MGLLHKELARLLTVFPHQPQKACHQRLVLSEGLRLLISAAPGAEGLDSFSASIILPVPLIVFQGNGIQETIEGKEESRT
jgi:hypothetical protein